MALLLRLRERNLAKQRVFLDRTNPLESFNNVRFKQLFRFEKANFLQLVDTLTESLEYPTRKSKALPATLQICIALNFYATGSFQSEIAAIINVDQSTACRSIWRVTKALIENRGNMIRFPLNLENIKREFFEIAGLPRIVGAVDGTHVEIQRPPSNQYPDEYINRYGTHSINVQVLCDASCRFLDVDASWPGSVHDSRIFMNSRINQIFASERLDGILLGDSGYRLLPYLLTPFLNPNTRPQELFNFSHKSSRVRIEMAIGQLKRRFSCLKTPLRISLERVSATVMACCILHNICKEMRDPDPDVQVQEEREEEVDEEQIGDEEQGTRRAGENTRNEIATALSLM